MKAALIILIIYINLLNVKVPIVYNLYGSSSIFVKYMQARLLQQF